MAAPPLTTFYEQIRAGFEEGDPLAHTKQAERNHVNLVIDLYEAVGEGDLDKAVALMSENIEFEIFGSASAPMVGRSVGREATKTALQRNFGLVEDQNPVVQSVIAQGDTVVVVAKETGRFKQTGQPYEIDWVQIFTFRAGQPVRFREIADMATLIQNTTVDSEPVGQ